MSEVEFWLLRDLIHESYGILLREDKKNVARLKLASRLACLGHQSFRDYITYLRQAPGRLAEREKMIAQLVNNETYFNREYEQLRVFGESVLPRLAKRKARMGDKRIRILSAGCSTGEEAYSLAAMLFEHGAFYWGWDMKVIGVDVSHSAIERARKGVYSSRAFRGEQARHIEKHFVPQEGGLEVKNSLKRLASFEAGNLMDPVLWDRIGKVDAIFCRNVLIYFSEQKMKTVLGRMRESLHDWGYLFLGHSEFLKGDMEGFEQTRLPGAVFYHKRLEKAAYDVVDDIGSGCG